MNRTRRTQRMASLLHAELARILLQEVADPRLTHLRITDVEVSNDCRTARIYYDLGSSDPKEGRAGLKKVIPFLRRQLGMQLDLKYVPELRFEQDKDPDREYRLMKLIEESK